MTRVMFDGITPGTVPAGAQIYAGYVGGRWPDYPALVVRTPGALHVSIAVAAGEDARVLDVETGDATPEQAPGWAARQRAAGNPYPVCYMNASTWPAVRAAFAAQHVPEPLYWVASYVQDPSQVPAIPAGAIALQYYDFGGYDAWVVADYWPGLDPALTPHPAPTPQEDEMQSTTSVNGRAGLSWAAGSRHVVQVTYDPAAGDPSLRIMLALTTGPWVAPEPLVPAHGSGSAVYQIEPDMVAHCRGVVLEGAASPVYDAVAV